MSTFDGTPTDGKPYILFETKDGNIAKSVAPLVRNIQGKQELVVAVIYNKEGLPIRLMVCTESKEVPSAEWEPLQRIG